jgi:hypothetical protein
MVAADNILIMGLMPCGAMALLRRMARAPRGGATVILPVLMVIYPLTRAFVLDSHQTAQMGRHIHNLMPVFYLLGAVARCGLIGGWPGTLSGCAFGAVGLLLVLGLADSLKLLVAERGWTNEQAVERARLLVWLYLLGTVGLWVAARRRQLRLKDAAPGRAETSPGALDLSGSTPRVAAKLGVFILILTAAVGAIRFVGYGGRAPHGLTGYRSYVRNSADMYLVLARWVAQHTPSDAGVAIFDKEAMKWYSRRRVIHLGGRTNPELAWHVRRAGDFDRGILSYLAKCRPQYLIICPRVHPWLASQGWLLDEVHRVHIQNNVHLGENPFVIYRMNWQVFDRIYGATSWSRPPSCNGLTDTGVTA